MRKCGIGYWAGFEVEIFLCENRIRNNCRTCSEPKERKFMTDLNYEANRATRGFFDSLRIGERADGANSAGNGSRVANLGLTIETDSARKIHG
jgi:hypothetical protein